MSVKHSRVVWAVVFLVLFGAVISWATYVLFRTDPDSGVEEGGDDPKSVAQVHGDIVKRC